jgi:hypothetical protein
MNSLFPFLKAKKFFIVSILVIIFQLLISFLINYPPLPNQILGGINVWFFRILSLGFSCFLIFFYLKKWNIIIILISPFYWILWYCYPLILFELIAWIFVIKKIQKNKVWIILLFLLVILRIGVQDRSFILWDKIKPEALSTEVNIRFKNEDSLSFRPSFPLFFRRLSYNKPFFATKNILGEINSFFDIEALFFQEFHPLEQKGIIIFYWFEIFLLTLGVFYFLKKKRKREILIFFVFSFIYFIFSKEILFLRFALLWYTLSYLISLSFEKVHFVWKVFFLLFLIYSFVISFLNFATRPEHWLDNKPIVFDYCFNNLPSKEDVYVTRIIGFTDEYAQYYWGSDYSVNSELEGSKYICIFAGEFSGRTFNNSLVDNWQDFWSDENYKILDYKELKDSVAHGYSDYIVIGELK